MVKTSLDLHEIKIMTLLALFGIQKGISISRNLHGHRNAVQLSKSSDHLVEVDTSLADITTSLVLYHPHGLVDGRVLLDLHF